MTDKLLAGRCQNGHATVPPMDHCPHCGGEQSDQVGLEDRTGTVVTWTESTVTPRGVREPNTLALVEFTVGETSVRVLGQTTDDVGVGDDVRPVYVDSLRDPTESIRANTGQEWDGFRFEPVE